MKTCHIVGHAGFDLDVLYNLTSFYRSLRLHVFFSRTPAPADVLAVVRPQPMALPSRNYGFVHVWDYVGDAAERVIGFVRSAGENCIVLTSSEFRRRELVAAAPELDGRVTVLLPPVDVDMWTTRRAMPRRRPIVHIGHFKPYYADARSGDVYAERFLRLLCDEQAHVWGAGWRGAEARNWHGALNPFRVSRTYATAGVGLGMMYPFQRDRTLSGRFWHAPLNGCALLSEPSVYSRVIPGVVETTYEAADVERVTSGLSDGDDIREKAVHFWRDAFHRAQDELSGRIRRGGFSRAATTGSLACGAVNSTGRRAWRRVASW